MKEYWDERRVEMTRRFEEVAEAYLAAGDEQRAEALKLLPGQEEAFLKGVGLYHLLTDEAFYKSACQAVAEQFRKEMGK